VYGTLDPKIFYWGGPVNYGEILNNAWKIIWKHKVLWLFGFLASCGARQGSDFNYPSQASNPGSANTLPLELENWAHQVELTFERNPGLIGLIIFIFLLVILLLAILNTIGAAGSMRGPWLVAAGAGRLPFSELWEDSLGCFWRVFFINLTSGFATWAPVLILIMLGVLSIGSANLTTALICVSLGICQVFIPYLWLVQVWFNQASVAAVGENLSFSESISQGWTLATKNLGAYIVMSLILSVVTLAIGFIFSLPLIVILAPLVPVLMAGGTLDGSSALTTALITYLCYSPVLMIVNSIVVAYVNASWTLTYRQVRQRMGLLSEPVEVLQPGLGQL
jgi:hypothetical protein